MEDIPFESHYLQCSYMGLSENSVSHIPMDYHHVPHKIAICGYPLFSDKPIYSFQLVQDCFPSTISWNIMDHLGEATRRSSKQHTEPKQVPMHSHDHSFRYTTNPFCSLADFEDLRNLNRLSSKLVDGTTHFV